MFEVARSIECPPSRNRTRARIVPVHCLIEPDQIVVVDEHSISSADQTFDGRLSWTRSARRSVCHAYQVLDNSEAVVAVVGDISHNL